MPHTKARRFKPQARLEPPQQHWWQAKKADVLTVTPRVALHHLSYHHPPSVNNACAVLILSNMYSTCVESPYEPYVCLRQYRVLHNKPSQWFVCWLVASRPSNTRVYLRDGSAQTSLHTEIEVADQTFHLTQSQYTDTGPTSPSTDPITPGAWQGSHWSANFLVTGMTRSRKNPVASGIRTRDLPLSKRTP